MPSHRKENPASNFEDLFKQQLHTANLTLALENRFSASKHLKLDFLAAVDNKPRRTNETCLICGERNVSLHNLLSFFKEDHLFRGNMKSQVVKVVVTDCFIHYLYVILILFQKGLTSEKRLGLWNRK